MDVEGNVQPGAEKYADLPKPFLNSMLKSMIQSEVYDNVFFGE
jgi:2-oxoisovalerate dehydrogenase E1 component alpha subunit